jgi:BASS family bile acid:Na+ symporter
MTLVHGLVLAAQASIVLTVLGLGLSARWDDATYLLRRPALLLRSVLSMSVVMPIVAAFIATLFALRPEVQAALVALAVSPVPPLVQKKQLASGGRMEYVVGLFVAMAVLAIVLVPLTIWILDQIYGRSAVVAPEKVAKIMLTTVFAPLAVGLAIRHLWPATEKAAHVVIAIAGMLLLVACAVLLYGLWPVIRTYIGTGAWFLLLILAVIGLGVGHVLGGPLPADRTTLAISTSSRHPAVALTVATSGVISDTKAEVGIIILYLVIATLVAIPYQKWRSRTAHATPHPAT